MIVKWESLVLSAVVSALVSLTVLKALGSSKTASVDSNSSGNVLRAREFHLVDESGHPRAVLKILGEDLQMALSDSKGKLAISMTISAADESLGFTMQNQDNSSRATLHLTSRRPGLSFYDMYGTLRAQVCLRHGQPVIALADENRTVRLLMTVMADRPQALFYDEKGELIKEIP